jgi:hypothetical protein
MTRDICRSPAELESYPGEAATNLGQGSGGHREARNTQTGEDQRRAAAGVSIMTPVIGRPASCAARAKLRTSSTVLIMGAMTQTSADSAAAASLIAFS